LAIIAADAKWDLGATRSCDRVIRQPHHPRRALAHHVETLAHVGLFPDMTDIGVQVGHAHLRAIAERRERIEDVVARQRAVDPMMQELVRRHDAARYVVIVGVMTAHQIKVGRR
jgi:hypothetical protein